MNQRQAKERIHQMISFVQEEAKEKAREIESKTQHEYNNAKAKFLHQAKEQLTAEYDKKWKQLEIKRRIERSSAINTARMDVMKTRNECMNSLLDQARLRIHQKHADDSDSYKEVLTMLIVEGLIRMLENDVEIRCREVDVDLVEEVLDDAKSRYEEVMLEQTGKSYTTNLSIIRDNPLLPPPEEGSAAPSCCGGVILLSHKRKIRCINTLDRRIELAYDASVPQLRKIIFA